MNEEIEKARQAKREATRLRVEKHRAKLKAEEDATLGEVDCEIQVSNKRAWQILEEERA